MQDLKQSGIPKWPFYLGDAFMVGVAFFIVWQAKLPLTLWEIVACAVCVLLAALLGIVPFFLEHQTVLKTIEAAAVGKAGDKIKDVEKIAAQIGGAARLWENAHVESEKVTGAAREIAQRMESELRDFKEFLTTANDTERANMKLEVDKLRRAEAEWLQILVRILDHVYALFTAAEKSGQQALIGQIGQFQNACRDSARRVGLAPFVAARAEAFDGNKHKWADGEKPDAGAIVSETLATGYSFQGKLIRPALVRVKQESIVKSRAQPEKLEDTSQNQLPLEAANPSST